MASAAVLAVGNCGPDQAALRAMIETGFQATVAHAETLAAARDELDRNRYDLVIVNRVGDADGQPGLDLVRWVGQRGLDTPIMLLSNYPDAQAQAQAAGAVAGFGKAELAAAQTHARLAAHLPTRAEQPQG